MSNRFLQIHFLTSYPATLLNRDDAGFAKRVPFGGAERTRVSSQCLKRHWRTFEGPNGWAEIGVPETVRSRYTFEREVVEPLIAAGQIPEDKIRATAELVMAAVLGESAKAKAKGKEGVELKTGQITVLGRPEVDYLRALTAELAAKVTDAKKAKDELKADFDRDFKANLAAVPAPAQGLSAALFGRMVTSSVLARSDAALHVAHAFTVHEQQDETDYFSAIDELQGARDDDQLGSGHIGNTELTTGLFYGYVVVDLPLLVSNITGCDQKDWEKADRTAAADVVERLVHLVATVSPGAKLGSTAPHAYAQAVLVEAGDAQPRTLANAFLKPVKPLPDLRANTYRTLGEHLSEMDAVYATGEQRALFGLGVADLREQAGANGLTRLTEVAAWAKAQVLGAQ